MIAICHVAAGVTGTAVLVVAPGLMAYGLCAIFTCAKTGAPIRASISYYKLLA
jgi:hypothetical protein